LQTWNTIKAWFAHMEHNKSLVCTHGTQLKLGLHTWNTIQAWFAHMEHNSSLVCTHGTQ